MPSNYHQTNFTCGNIYTVGSHKNCENYWQSLSLKYDLDTPPKNLEMDHYYLYYN